MIYKSRVAAALALAELASAASMNVSSRDHYTTKKLIFHVNNLASLNYGTNRG